MNADTHGRPGPKACAACDGKLEPDVIYFCRTCWFILPGNERAAFTAMYVRRDNVGAKLAKCARIIRDRRAIAPDARDKPVASDMILIAGDRPLDGIARSFA